MRLNDGLTRGRLGSSMDGLATLLRLAVGVVFIASGLLKAAHPDEFFQAVLAYKLVGQGGSLLVAMAVPWVEMALGACIISGAMLEGALLAAVVLLAVFSAVLITALAKHMPIGCGCFGVGSNDETISYWTVGRTLVLLCVAAWLFLRPPAGHHTGRKATDFASANPASPS